MLPFFTDYKQMIELVKLLVQKVTTPSGTLNAEDRPSEVVDVILQLMLCILDGLQCSNKSSVISDISLQWAPVFELRNTRCCIE